MLKWEGRKVLVTGAEGFIGSHLVERLVELGADITAFVLYNSFNRWGWIDTFNEEIRRHIKVFTGDIRDEQCVREAVGDREVVFHLAALIAIPYSYHAPASYIDVNVKGTLNVLQACRDAQVSKIIHTSTSEVYGTAKYVPMDENHPLQGQSPYAASKIAADMLAESYYRSFDLPVAVLRPFNTYGPRQSARAVIPAIISQLIAGKDILKLGALTPKRDFNYVKDTAEGFIKVAESELTTGTITNLGSGQEISIGDLTRRVAQLMGKGDVKIVCEEERLRPEKSEVNRLCADNRKILSLTEWRPEYTLDEGLKETIQWVKDNISYFKTDIYNL